MEDKEEGSEQKGEVTIHDETKALQGEGMAAGWQPGTHICLRLGNV